MQVTNVKQIKTFAKTSDKYTISLVSGSLYSILIVLLLFIKIVY